MIDFDLSSLDARDEADLAIRHPTTNEVTTWVWTFYGPGHPKTVELANRVASDALREAAAQKAARINGRKWKEEERSPNDVNAELVDGVVARTKTFTPVKLGDETINFSPEAARKLLLDRRKGWLLAQTIEFLRAEESFILPSAKS